MKAETIRINAITSKWEHYVEATAIQPAHWAPGLTGGDDNESDYSIDQLPDENVDGVLLSYNFFTYGNETFELLQITQQTSEDFQELNTKTLEKLTATDPIANANGPYESAIGLPVIFTSEGSEGGITDIVSYHWDVGDGTTSTFSDFEHIYNRIGIYETILTIKNGIGQKAIDIATVNIIEEIPDNYYPLPNLNGPYFSLDDKFIRFKSRGSDGGNSDITEYFWDLGDGTTANTSFVKHKYNIDSPEQIFNITLTLKNAYGLYASGSTTATITKEMAPPDLMAKANGPYEGEIKIPILFSSRGSYSEHGIKSYHWDFGDGLFSSLVDPSHKYIGKGIYNVQLTITDNQNNIATDTTQATIDIIPI